MIPDQKLKELKLLDEEYQKVIKEASKRWPFNFEYVRDYNAKENRTEFGIRMSGKILNLETGTFEPFEKFSASYISDDKLNDTYIQKTAELIFPGNIKAIEEAVADLPKL